jgi:hypothetical protein
MAQYQVPQFIEVEDKIFGPLTIKQFIWLAGGVGLCLVFFTLLPFYLFILCAIPVMSAAAALAFYQVNGRPLIDALEHGFNYLVSHKLYLWKQRTAEAPKPAAEAPSAPAALPVPKLSESKLRDLSWSLNIKDRTALGSQVAEHAGLEI